VVFLNLFLLLPSKEGNNPCPPRGHSLKKKVWSVNRHYCTMRATGRVIPMIDFDVVTRAAYRGLPLW
jgi:hypothetical protein